jgi:hypothetical protein
MQESNIFHLTGLPEEMDEDEIAEVVVASESLADSEVVGGRRQVSVNIPPQSDPARKISLEDLAVLKGRFPHLADFSDSFLMSRTTDELLRIESTSMKLRDAERSRDVEDRLHANKSALATKTAEVMAGVDNRWNILHAARFLGGAACSAQELWSQARAVIGINGHPPLSNYDMTAVGLGGFVTAKGWLELGNPASTKISLKLFNINNCTARASASRAAAASDELLEVADLGEFKLALRALRTAGQFVMPWNYSFLALEGFLLQTDFCKAELLGDDRPAATLTQFVDFILQTNADRWRDSLGFLTTGELAAYWASFHGARPKQKAEAAKTSKKDSAAASTTKKEKRVRFPWVDVCHQWNTGKCNKAPGACTSSRGTVLRHVCDWRDLANPAVICGQAHKRLQFH